ncbi:MAG TPA: ankyrin repeat domain-containing protein, partial [Acidobacteriaceae bacterium]
MSFDAWKAMKRGDVVGLRNALDSGLDPNYPDSALRSGATLLMLAAHTGNTAIGRELVSHGAFLDARDNQGWTALCS